MNTATRWTLGLLGTALLMAMPYLWHINIMLLWIVVPLLAVWAFWLMMEYLAWAKSLGKK